MPARAAARVGRRPAAPTMAAITVSTSAAVATCSSPARPHSTVACQPGRAQALSQTLRGTRHRHTATTRRAETRRIARTTGRPAGRADNADDSEALGMARDHVQRVARRCCRWNRGWRRRCTDSSSPGALRQHSAASGRLEVSASMRSSTPPCPGSSVPLSLTPAWRLIHDSNRSPRMLNAVSTQEHHQHRPDRSSSATPAGAASRSTMKYRITPTKRAGHALPGLARADLRRQLVAAETAAGEIGGGIGDPHHHRAMPAAGRACAADSATAQARPAPARIQPASASSSGCRSLPAAARARAAHTPSQNSRPADAGRRQIRVATSSTRRLAEPRIRARRGSCQHDQDGEQRSPGAPAARQRRPLPAAERDREGDQQRTRRNWAAGTAPPSNSGSRTATVRMRCLSMCVETRARTAFARPRRISGSPARPRTVRRASPRQLLAGAAEAAFARAVGVDGPAQRRRRRSPATGCR